MVQKPMKVKKLLVRATFIGHISKGIWVSQDIAGWELFASKLATMMKNNGRIFDYFSNPIGFNNFAFSEYKRTRFYRR
jgi:hypothetical protein